MPATDSPDCGSGRGGRVFVLSAGVTTGCGRCDSTMVFAVPLVDKVSFSERPCSLAERRSVAGEGFSRWFASFMANCAPCPYYEGTAKASPHLQAEAMLWSGQECAQQLLDR